MRAGRKFPNSLLALSLLAAVLQPTFAPSASAAITTAACRDTFGTPVNVTLAVTGNDCLIYFYGSSTWTPAAGYSTVRFLLVGGGAAGRLDGGGGGGGGGGLSHSSLAVSSGVTTNVVVGAGGNADSQSNGGQTKLDTNNDGTFEWTVNGGSVGGGWDTRLGGSAGSASAQTGATVLNGGNGGAGPATTGSGTAAAGGGSNGFTSDITGTTYYYGGGGGGGIGSHSNGVNNYDIGYANGGYGGGGAGAAQRARNTAVAFSYLGIDGSSQTLTAVCDANAGYPGTTVGFNGRDGFGGGGGGGSAYGDGCSSSTSYDGERNRGGYGGNGVVIIRYTPDVTASVITGPGSATGSTSSISIAENSTSVHTFTANETVTWAKSGADAARFTLTGATLTITARDFETPQSTLSSNVYVVVITATDASTNPTSQTLSVTITNVNERPVIGAFSAAETATYSAAENSTSLFNINATDVDTGTSLTYSLTGTDAADFSIASNGVLSFSPAPDFEAPSDSDQNNTYVVVTWASDGALSDSQTVTITVTNISEDGSITAPTISGTAYKGVAIALTVSLNAQGKVRFFFDGKRIANCLAISTTGSRSSHSATCNWKPTVTGRHNVTATFTPSSGTFTSKSSAPQTIWILKRTTSRS